MDNALEERARQLYYLNAKNWNAPRWDELHEDTRQLWRDFAKDRMPSRDGDTQT